MSWEDATGVLVGLVLGACVMGWVMDATVGARAKDLEAKLTRETLALEQATEQVMFYERLLLKIFPELPTGTMTLPVTVTAYSARIEECDDDPWFTADMSLSRVGMLAVSRDLLHEIGLEYGQVVILEGLGVFKVRDTMNERFRRRVDILMANAEAARRFGKREAQLTWLR